MPCKFLVVIVVSCLTQHLIAQRFTRSLSEFKHTEFVTTLDHNIHFDKNAIYSPSLLLAWDDLRNSLAGTIEVDTADHDLYLFNQSRDFENTLHKNDYTGTFKVAYNAIHVKASFKKSLQLFVPMTSYASELVFDGKEVPAFGEKGESRGSAVIRYYKDDNNVVVELHMENKSQEMLIFKTETKFSTMREAISALKENIKTGSEEIQSGNHVWKYDFAKSDRLLIPKIKFDIRTDFPTMEEKVVHGRGTRLDVMELIQQTSFSLDEKGMETESIGGVGEVVVSEPVVDEARKVKKIVFDKPFFVFVKRKDSENPYLVLWIANTELMK